MQPYPRCVLLNFVKMKILILFALLAVQAHGQDGDSWKIKWNGEVLIEARKEDPATNMKSAIVERQEDTPLLEIAYTESPPKKDWKRSIMIFGESNNELKRFDTSNVVIGFDELKELIGENKLIKIYTISLPTDPELAAMVRVRRVHLATIDFREER